MFKKFLPLFFAVVFAMGCSTNPITGRNQLSLVGDDVLNQTAKEQYAQFLRENQVIKSGSQAQMVNRVGKRIANAITRYYRQQGSTADLSGYNWEFNLINSKEINAWCMPGGKVAVYSGLMPVAKNETGLAIVMGHEIAHAIAKHSNERLSQVMAAQGLGTLANVATSGNAQFNNIFNNVYGPAANLGVLMPNGRRQELEADRFGMIFAAMAGYDPREAIPFWQRMQSAASGNAPPEFLSTHPADETRISEIQKHLPEALTYYKK